MLDKKKKHSENESYVQCPRRCGYFEIPDQGTFVKNSITFTSSKIPKLPRCFQIQALDHIVG